MFDAKFHTALYTDLYRIRTAEEAIQAHYNEDEMKTPMHMSMGGEAIAAGVCAALDEGDDVFGTYRSHAIYIARVKETEKFFAEMYGKKTGTARGKAGSMHLASPEHGLIMTSAVVGTTIPVAVGAAFAHAKKKDGNIAAVFFGDGATDEGVFWESVNLACSMQLPVLFICEDNELAIHTPASHRHGYERVTEVVAQFSCEAESETTTDVERIYEITKDMKRRMKETGRPGFLHLPYYRYLEHVGVNKDFNQGYRSKAEFEEWYTKDPVTLQRKRLIKSGVIESEITALESEINTEVEESVARAKQAPFAEAEETYKDVYHE